MDEYDEQMKKAIEQSKITAITDLYRRQLEVLEQHNRNNQINMKSTNQNNQKPKFKSKKPCKYFQNGYCNKGDNCEYQHVLVKINEPCKFFQNGTCTMGDKCRYLHIKVTNNQSKPKIINNHSHNKRCKNNRPNNQVQHNNQREYKPNTSPFKTMKDCRYGSKCTNKFNGKCKYIHPKPVIDNKILDEYTYIYH
jgi:hypothetical protein